MDPWRTGAYFHARWDVREETIADCAKVLTKFLRQLESLSPLLNKWRDTSRTTDTELAKSPSTVDAEAMTRLLLDRRPRFRGKVIEPAGSSFALWNGRPINQQVEVSGLCAVRFARRWTSCIELSLPLCQGEEAQALYMPSTAEATFDAVVRCWRPRWAAWYNNELLSSQEFRAVHLFVGWQTYVSEPVLVSGLQELPLPQGSSVRPFADGVIVQLDQSPADVRTDQALAVRDLIRELRQA